ncbi:MAG: ATP-binding protein [Thermoleophilia bacterium]|nr:ATP-binding protein [Thermoleophilia bacterium]
MHVKRAITDLAASYLDTFRVVQISGPRQAGKSTLARTLASDRARTEITFDDDEVQRRAAADPYGFLLSLGTGPILIDEAQRVPEIYLAIKRIVDLDSTRGRFLLTGSSDPLSNRRVRDSLAGRIGIVDLRPFSQGEMSGRDEQFVAQVFGAGEWGSSALDGAPAYLPRIIRGGFPEAVAMPDAARGRWFASYLESAFARDVRDVVSIADLGKLRRVFDLVASHSGQILKSASIARDAGLSANTVRGWIDALAQTRLVDVIPGWSGGRRGRLVSAPKAHVADSGLLVGSLRVGADGLLGAPMLLGSAVETFAVQEVLRQLTRFDAGDAPQPYHYRDRDQREVDLVLEHPDGRIVGIEVKAASTVRAGDAAGLRALREASGTRFHRGIVLYCGMLPFALDEQIDAVPLEALWSA